MPVKKGSVERKERARVCAVIPEDKEFLTVRECVILLKGAVSRGTIYAMVHRGELVFKKFGKKILISRKSLMGALEQQKEAMAGNG